MVKKNESGDNIKCIPYLCLKIIIPLKKWNVKRECQKYEIRKQWTSQRTRKTDFEGWFLDINLINIEINKEINCKERHSESEESLYSTGNIHEEIENV